MSAFSDRARFAAREFVADLLRQTGEQLCPDFVERLEFVYEMGYLRGGGEALKMFDAPLQKGDTPK